MLHPIVRYFPHARRWTATDRYELVLTSGAEEQRFFHERLCNTVGCSDLNGLASACGVGTQARVILGDTEKLVAPW